MDGDNVSDIELIEVSKEYEEQAMVYRQEFIDYDEKLINGSSGLIEYDNYDEWLDKVATEKVKECSSTDTSATTYFTYRKRDNKIIGSVKLRHHLTEELEKDGGNIGYGICPSERGKGYGSLQLSLALEKARAMNMSKIMITCNKDNRGSALVAIHNGGVLSGEGFDEDEAKVTEIYWIYLD